MQRDSSLLKNRKFDVLVCGGGIYGAWTAYDAALRGIKVAIVDKGDWAGATSSASSKLIHGGLRYLETMDFKLVKKSLAERRMLLQAAPHRVWPLRFGVPVYKTSRIGKIRLKCGLSLYDFLAGDIPSSQAHKQHSQTDFSQHFPSLDSADLKGGFTYFDAQTDDARLVLELIDGALSAGAVCVNYCELTELIEINGKACGAVLHDKVNDESISVNADLIVDTTGRWTAAFRADKSSFRLTKGIHLVMPRMLQDEALLLTAKSDGRVFFIIPWYGMTLLGTTDSDYVGELDNIPITEAEISYLLTEANQVLTAANWTKQDIVGKFAGVRVLQDGKGNNPSSLSRDWRLNTAPNGLLSSIGGKLTSAREDAAVIVDTLCQQLGKPGNCQTFGKAFPWIIGTDYQHLLGESLNTAKHLEISEETILWLVKRHGNRITSLFQICQENPELSQAIMPDLPFIKAELVFCANEEMVVHLDDLLRRRIPLMILAKMSSEEISQIAKIAAKALRWDNKKTDEEIGRCEQAQANNQVTSK